MILALRNLGARLEYMKTLNFFTIWLLSGSLLINSNPVLAQDKKVDVKEVLLPSEVEHIKPGSGAFYATPSKKDKILIPVHFWGEVKNSGLHYIPTGTSLVRGISLAGGPSNAADLEEVTLTRRQDSDLFKRGFDLSEGGNTEAHMLALQPHDTVFIQKDWWRADRSYYTSLIGVIVTLLTGILVYRQVKRDRQ